MDLLTDDDEEDDDDVTSVGIFADVLAVLFPILGLLLLLLLFDTNEDLFDIKSCPLLSTPSPRSYLRPRTPKVIIKKVVSHASLSINQLTISSFKF